MLSKHVTSLKVKGCNARALDILVFPTREERKRHPGEEEEGVESDEEGPD